MYVLIIINFSIIFLMGNNYKTYCIYNYER